MTRRYARPRSVCIGAQGTVMRRRPVAAPVLEDASLAGGVTEHVARTQDDHPVDIHAAGRVDLPVPPFRSLPL